MSAEKNLVISTFMQIVQIDSPTFHEEEMAKDVHKRLTEMGLSPEIDKEGNVRAFLEGDESKEVYILNAHLDTVEPGKGIKPQIDSEGWIRSSGDTILGADNKAGVAAILEATRRLIDGDSSDHHPLELVFTVSEESGNHGAAGLDYSSTRSKLGYAFDVAGQNFGDIIISSPFYNRIDIDVVGQSAHAKDPDIAKNVLYIFRDVMNNIKLGKISANTIANFGIVRSGEAVNTIPGQMTINGEVRSTVESELEENTNNIKEAFGKASDSLGAKTTVTVTRENPGYKLEKDDTFLLKTVKLLNKFGVEPKLIDSMGCADANLFAGSGIKIINIADGSQGAHTLDERIKVNDLERLVDLICLLVKD